MVDKDHPGEVILSLFHHFHPTREKCLNDLIYSIITCTFADANGEDELLESCSRVHHLGYSNFPPGNVHFKGPQDASHPDVWNARSQAEVYVYKFGNSKVYPGQLRLQILEANVDDRNWIKVPH